MKAEKVFFVLFQRELEAVLTSGILSNEKKTLPRFSRFDNFYSVRTSSTRHT
jgi:hypothetical protein